MNHYSREDEAMRYLLIVAIAIPLVAPAAARADEADDALAKRMASVVRDFRQPLATRVEAVRTLEKLGARAAVVVPELVAVLDRIRGTEQEPLQEAIVEALGQMGSPAKAALVVLAKSKNRTADLDLAIKRSTEAILNASDSQEIDALTQQLLSRDASTRLRAAKALADIGPAARTALPLVTLALADPDNDVRRAAIIAYRLIQPNAKPSEAFIRAIAVDLKDPDAILRLLALRSLARIGSPAAIVANDIDALRGDPDADVRRAAFDAFARVTTPLMP